jgi:hypothetical protein
MIKDGNSNRIAGSVRSDRTGEVFLVVSTKGVPLRQCLVCESVFTPEEAREHYTVRCEPSQQTDHQTL